MWRIGRILLYYIKEKTVEIGICNSIYVSINTLASYYMKNWENTIKPSWLFSLGAKIRGSFPFFLHINFTQNVTIAKA